MQLFGYEFKRVQKEEPKSFAPEVNEDGAAVVSAFGTYGTVVDLDGTVRTEAELINKYRDMALQPEIDAAIEEIVSDAIVNEDDQEIVEIDLDKVELQDNIKEVIREEFKNILDLLNFNTESYNLFRQYYIDGKMYFHAMIDDKQPFLGIQKLRYIDPRKMRKIREVQRKRDKNNPEVTLTQTVNEYYIYNEKGFDSSGKQKASTFSTNAPVVQGVKIAKDAIVYITSGVMDITGSMVLSHLHKAIKPMNQLRALEDATLIYRISRAPERRIFYIDVGNLPKAKAEQHLRDVMVKHKNKLVYDATTGEIRDDRRFMTMLEDFWLPRRGDGKATEITTLPAGQNLGELSDVVYFQKRLYNSLNVPVTRLDPERQHGLGRAMEVTRDEVKFARFIDRLRVRFSVLFLQLLEKQLILKQVATAEDWDLIKPRIRFKYARDNYFSELKNSEIWSDRVQRATQLQPYVGLYVSHYWMRKEVFKQTDEDMEEMDMQIAAEAEIPQYNPMLQPQPVGPDGMPLPAMPASSPFGGGPSGPPPSKGGNKK